MGPRRALHGGISKVDFEQSLSTFVNMCPQNGSKNEPRAPRTSLGCPHIGPFVDLGWGGVGGRVGVGRLKVRQIPLHSVSVCQVVRFRASGYGWCKD